MENKQKIPRSVGIWLVIGLIMVFTQVIIGGITRLTDSGLSITEWDIVKGILPPLNEVQWEEAFTLYKTNVPKQFQDIHPNMTLAEFKGIYFWEYFHRLWARSMGLVFAIPFFFFWRKGYFTPRLLRQLGVVVLMAAVVASFGWIMVASGLNTMEYAWVDAYKLTIHLSLATILLGYLFWVTMQTIQPATADSHNRRMRKFAWRITFIIGLQIALGGLMAGLKAGYLYNHFPTMEIVINPDGTKASYWIANILKNSQEWNVDNLVNYQKSPFAAALVQLLHRGTAYVLCLLIPIFTFTARRIHGSRALNVGSYLLLLVLAAQVTLGVYALLYQVPVALGVLHQGFGILLLLVMLFISYQFSKGGHYRTPKASKTSNQELPVAAH